MHKGRLEAFSDGVFAIIITIMVLEMHPPHSADLDALVPLVPVFVSYALSFANVGIYWANHHHMLQVASKVNGAVLWANLHLLFWLSLMPLVTGWMGENHFATVPVAFYGIDLTLCAVAYTILARALVRLHGQDSRFARALGSDLKGRVSLLAYVLAVALAFVNSWIAMALYVCVAIMWFVPDSRFARVAEPEAD